MLAATVPIEMVMFLSDIFLIVTTTSLLSGISSVQVFCTPKPSGNFGSSLFFNYDIDFHAIVFSFGQTPLV